jgi:hypothetical protein
MRNIWESVDIHFSFLFAELVIRLHWKSQQTAGRSPLAQILCFWTLSIVLSSSKTPSCLFFKTQRFGDWILSPSSWPNR